MSINRILAAAAFALLASSAAQADVRRCSKAQQDINRQIETSTKKTLADHIRKHFADKGSYLVSDSVYQRFVKGNRKLGRPGPGGDTYLFVAGGKFIDNVLARANKNGIYDFAAIETALGLPTGSYPTTGGLWRVDVNVNTNCARFARASDPGANAQFVPGGFTSGGVPEILVINGAPKFVKQVVKKGAQKPPQTSKPGKPGQGGKPKGKKS